ncbi:hypothetical protein ACFQ4C_26995 [Larkinella insperata]|uniref:Lipoprotein n=1 Tax=Larkinella insperata TaxID=332158 RepID=A0ABW3QFP9_9BACT|nr:hypothetical protein [Larkinella insperata]
MNVRIFIKIDHFPTPSRTMRQIVVLLALLVSACAPQQRLRTEPNRLLLQSTDINNTTASQPVKSIHPSFLGFGNLTIRYADGRTEKVSKKSVWGYTDKKGRVYRYYRNTYFEVLDLDEVVRYERTRPHSPKNPRLQQFYSKTLDSKLFNSRKKALRDLATL